MNKSVIAWVVGLACSILGSVLHAQQSVIQSFSGNGVLTWSNPVSNSVCHVEWASALTGTWHRSWAELQSIRVAGTNAEVNVPMFFRVACASNVPPNGLIAYYPFDGDVADASGNGYTGTLVGASFVSDRHDFDRHAMIVYYPHYVNLPAAVFNGRTSFSVTCWIKFETFFGLTHVISVANASVDNECTISYWPDPNNFTVFVKGTMVTFGPASTVEDKGWHHLAFIRDGSNAYLYLDGIKFTASGAVPAGALVAGANGVIVGEDQDVLGGGFESTQALAGRIDELRVYSRALSSSEVQTAYDLSR